MINLKSSQYTFIEDFNDNISDSKKNWEALLKCIETGKKIVLLNNDYYIKADRTYFTNNNIVITGINKVVSKLVFETIGLIHFDSIRETVTEDNVEIGKLSGINMSFENITLSTGNYETFKDNDYLNNAKFKNVYILQNVNETTNIPAGQLPRIVDVDFIEIKNCFVKGSLQILLGGNQKDYSETNGVSAPTIPDFYLEPRKYGVKTFTVEDNYIEYPYVLASISSFPRETNINRNTVYNLRHAMIKVSYANNVYFNDNHIKNDFIALPGMVNSSGYISGLVALGANKLECRRNTMNGVLSKSGCEVSFVFPSVRNFIWEDNTLIDSFGINPTPGVEINLIKLKQAENNSIVNSKFIITREAYVKMGLLENMNSPIETVNDDYYISFLSPSNDYNPEFKTKIKGCTFTLPHINRASLLMSDDHDITDNIFNIEYIAPMTDDLVPSRYNKPDLLFSVEGGIRKDFKFNNNTFNIGKSHNNELNVVGFEKSSHRRIENCNNRYYIEKGAKVSFGRTTSGQPIGKEGYICKDYIATDNFINKGSIEDVSGIVFQNFNYPFRQSTKVNYVIGESENISNETHLAGLDSFGLTEVKVLQNNSNSFGLFRFLFSDFQMKNPNQYFNNKKVDIYIKINALNNLGIEEVLFYKLTVNNITSMINNENKFQIIDRKIFKNIIKNAENKISQIELVHKNFNIDDSSYLVFENLINYKTFNISISVQKN